MNSRISISNIAWPIDADEEAYEFARSLGFQGIEIAPARTFSDWAAVDEAKEFRIYLSNLDLVIPALQGILFGVKNCELFSSHATRRNLAYHLAKVARIAGVLGAGACVFGAPKVRDPGVLSPQVAREIAITFFRDVADIFESEGSTLAFEANATVYDCRFINTTGQALDFVREIDRPGIRLQLDTGTIFLEKENPIIVADAAPLASHFHASEPRLATLGTHQVDHSSIGEALRNTDYAGWRSVEMRSKPEWKETMVSAFRVMADNYFCSE